MYVGTKSVLIPYDGISFEPEFSIFWQIEKKTQAFMNFQDSLCKLNSSSKNYVI